MQARHTNHTDVRVEMFMPLPICSIGERFRRALEMNREAVTTDAGIEGLVAKVQLESKPSAVLRSRRIEIVDQKLRCDSRELGDTRYDLCRHTRRSCPQRPTLAARQRRGANPDLQATECAFMMALRLPCTNSQAYVPDISER